MSTYKGQASASLTFPDLLTVLFIGLKLTGFINWGWLWVLSPIWLPLVFTLFVAIICLFIAVYKSYKKEKK